MRELKFRAKLADGTLIYSEEFLALSAFFERVSAEGLTVDQFTGLTDKHGKEIYEGDLVFHDLGGRCKVIFEDGCFVAESLNNGLFLYYMADEDGIRCCEVIGSIHLNPELLEGE